MATKMFCAEVALSPVNARSIGYPRYLSGTFVNRRRFCSGMFKEASILQDIINSPSPSTMDEKEEQAYQIKHYLDITFSVFENKNTIFDIHVFGDLFELKDSLNRFDSKVQKFFRKSFASAFYTNIGLMFLDIIEELCVDSNGDEDIANRWHRGSSEKPTFEELIADISRFRSYIYIFLLLSRDKFEMLWNLSSKSQEEISAEFQFPYFIGRKEVKIRDVLQFSPVFLNKIEVGRARTLV